MPEENNSTSPSPPDGASPPPRKRRPRYPGRNPRKFHEKYKELNPDRYPAEARKVVGALGARALEDTVAVAKAEQRLADGIDEGLLAELRKVVDALAAAVAAREASLVAA